VFRVQLLDLGFFSLFFYLSPLCPGTCARSTDSFSPIISEISPTYSGVIICPFMTQQSSSILIFGTFIVTHSFAICSFRHCGPQENNGCRSPCIFASMSLCINSYAASYYVQPQKGRDFRTTPPLHHTIPTGSLAAVAWRRRGGGDSLAASAARRRRRRQYGGGGGGCSDCSWRRWWRLAASPAA
jgi:hypothetical protein